jgi:L-aminopeptidase/D-esterase-like protein
MSWKPIDLAPRDGSTIVVAYRSPLTSEVVVSVSRARNGGWVRQSTAGEVEVSGDVAFAWIPLPDTDA